jgi:outer membrane protein OmpA-like peptidoglycan-associated protein
MPAPHAPTENAAWSTILAAFALLTACAEQSDALIYGSDPNYAMVFFDSGSSSLGKQAKQKLSDVVSNPLEPIKSVLKPDSSKKICVTGNTDNIGSQAANKELGQRRADAVAKYLVELGVPERRIVTSSLGSSKPLVVTPPNTPEVVNRRVEVVFGC